MKNNLYLFFTIISIIFSSCATIFNSNQTSFKIYSQDTSLRVKSSSLQDTTFNTLPYKFNSLRKNTAFPITIKQQDSISTLNIKSKLSNMYLIGNAFNTYGYFIDLISSKRFSYPNKNFIYKHNSQLHILPYIPPVKGLINIHYSCMSINNFYRQYNYTTTASTWSYLGIMSGLDYCFNHKHGISFTAGTSTDFEIVSRIFWMLLISPLADFQIPLYSDYFFNIEKINFYKKFDIRYGLNITYAYDEKNYNHIKENKIGLSLSSNYNLNHKISLGINYTPTFYTINNNEDRSTYGHSLRFYIKGCSNLLYLSKKNK